MQEYMNSERRSEISDEEIAEDENELFESEYEDDEEPYEREYCD